MSITVRPHRLRWTPSEQAAFWATLSRLVTGANQAEPREFFPSETFLRCEIEGISLNSPEVVDLVISAAFGSLSVAIIRLEALAKGLTAMNKFRDDWAVRALTREARRLALLEEIDSHKSPNVQGDDEGPKGSLYAITIDDAFGRDDVRELLEKAEMLDDFVDAVSARARSGNLGFSIDDIHLRIEALEARLDSKEWAAEQRPGRDPHPPDLG